MSNAYCTPQFHGHLMSLGVLHLSCIFTSFARDSSVLLCKVLLISACEKFKRPALNMQCSWKKEKSEPCDELLGVLSDWEGAVESRLLSILLGLVAVFTTMLLSLKGVESLKKSLTMLTKFSKVLSQHETVSAWKYEKPVDGCSDPFDGGGWQL